MLLFSILSLIQPNDIIYIYNKCKFAIGQEGIFTLKAAASVYSNMSITSENIATINYGNVEYDDFIQTQSGFWVKIPNADPYTGQTGYMRVFKSNLIADAVMDCNDLQTNEKDSNLNLPILTKKDVKILMKKGYSFVPHKTRTINEKTYRLYQLNK